MAGIDVRATYRVQLHAGFDFQAARELVPYLAQLGISHLYTSPVVRAREGSLHGYDVVDPTAISAELGGEEQFLQLTAELARHGMGLLLDIVPNHMAASEESPWWRSVLAQGQASPWAKVFDIYWSGADRWGTFDRRLLLPVLGVPYGQALAQGVLRVEVVDGEVAVRCYDRALPTGPSTWPMVLGDLRPTDPAAPARLAALSTAQVDALVRAQPWQPVHWRLAAEIAGYRRFFDINDLVGVRTEDAEVFAATHRLVLDLVRRGLVQGLRVDHVDGLRDPRGYLQRLAAATDFIVVEKILAGDERLPLDWPVAGTVGYEFGSAASAVFVDRDGLEQLAAIYRRFTANAEAFEDLVFRLKRKVLDELFSGERDRLASFLRRLAAASTAGLDLSPLALKEALVAVTAALPVYRTYIDAAGAHDDRYLRQAIDEARRRRPDLDAVVFDFLAAVLAGDDAVLPAAMAADRLDFVMSWQQLTGPVMAKGVEDTALYRWTPLLSLNAVGAEPDPDPARLSIDAFHEHNDYMQRHWPRTLLSTSTHDSKRGEDVRCRLHALADMPRQWQQALRRFSRRNRRLRVPTPHGPVPDPIEEVLLYQTLLGAWPLRQEALAAFPERVTEFTIKAAREAKRRTSWVRPDEAHEAALRQFVAALLGPESGAFQQDFARLQRRIAAVGAWNSLAMLTLKLASPGVPDFYQGSELWHFRLVDPDNRQPVDFARRRAMLAALPEGPLTPAQTRSLLADFADSRIKLLVTHRGLQLRRQRPRLFADGDYQRLEVQGRRSGHVCAFVRRWQEQWLLCAVPSRLGQLTTGRPPIGHGIWRDTEVLLPDGAPTTFRDELTGRQLHAPARRLPAAELFQLLPVLLGGST